MNSSQHYDYCLNITYTLDPGFQQVLKQRNSKNQIAHFDAPYSKISYQSEFYKLYNFSVILF